MSFLEIKERRSNNPALLKPFKKFKPVMRATVYESVGSTCGNIQEDIEGKWVSVTEGHALDIFGGHRPFYQAVSAPYLLARLVAAGFTPEVEGQAGYKVTWVVWLQHKETGHFLSFYDYKGASSYGSDVYGKTAPEEFVKDAREVVSALANDSFPHPYDRCVVGEIA